MRDRTCVRLTPFLRFRDARLSARQDACGYRYLRLRAHPTRMLATTHYLARPIAVCAGVPLSTCLHVCRERMFFRFPGPRSTFSSAACGHRHLHLHGQLERVRAAPHIAHCAHAIDARALTDHVFSCRCAHRSHPSAGAILAVLGAMQRTLAFRTSPSRGALDGVTFVGCRGRTCDRCRFVVCLWRLCGVVRIARFAPWDVG